MLEASTGCRIPSCISPWNCSPVSRWNVKADISTHFHLLGRLPRKVRYFYPFFHSLTDQCFRVLIATIKDMGSCPCPRCLLPKASFDLLGLLRDTRNRLASLRTYCLESVAKARTFIYSLGNTVNGSKVQVILGDGSWVPTVVCFFGINHFLCLDLTFNQNAFVEKLGPLGFDAFRILVVDFMHECELGTWKALFTHLIRLLYALPNGDRLVATLDNRSVPHCPPLKLLKVIDFATSLHMALALFANLRTTPPK